MEIFNQGKPIYLQIEDKIRKDITEGVYKADSRLPTERELMEQFSVSRMTIRQVINNLVGRGLIYRIKGRGAFVQKELFLKNQGFKSITTLMAESGIEVRTAILYFKKVIPPEITRLKLGIDEYDTAFAFKRTRSVDGEIIAVECNYLSTKRFPDLDQHDFSKESLYSVFENSYGYKLGYQKEVVSACYIPDEEKSILYGNENVDFALRIENLVYSEESEPLMQGECFYHYDKYSYFNISQKK